MKQDVVLDLVALDTRQPIWRHFYTVAPLVVIGSKEGDGYDLAPKHMAMPLGRDNYFGFICTPDHRTWHNVKREGIFTVSFPVPDQVVLASLAASPRCGEALEDKPIVSNLPTYPAPNIDAPFLENGYLYLECMLDRIVDGFGDYGLIAGQVVGAYVNPKSLRVSEGDDEDLIWNSPMLAYLAYGRFAKIRETYAFPFTKGQD